jgi:branched-chain amino acid transport system permease protein
MDWLNDNTGVLLNGLAIGLLLFMMSVGLTVIFGLLDVLNLAHGAFFLAGAYIGYTVAGEATATWAGFFSAVVIAIVVGLVMGVGLMVATAPLANRGHTDQALLTLGLGLVISELLLLTFGRDDHSMAAPGRLAESTRILSTSYPLYRLVVIVVGVAVAAAIWYFLEHTPGGALVRATVVDREMVEAVGVNVRLVFLVTFACSTALAVVGGVLAAPVMGASAGLGDETLLLALVVIVIGGMGSVIGTLLASVLIGLVQNVAVLVAPEVSSFVLFGAMVLVLTFRPQGLIPAATAAAR